MFRWRIATPGATRHVPRLRRYDGRSVDVIRSLPYRAHDLVALVDHHAVGATITIFIEPTLDRAYCSIRPGHGFRRAIAVNIGHADSDGGRAKPFPYVILSLTATVDHTPDHFWQ